MMVIAGGLPTAPTRLASWSCCARALLLLVCWAGLCTLLLPPAAPPAPAFPLQNNPEVALLEDWLRAHADNELYSLPLAYWHKHRYDTNKFHESKNCAPFPSVFDLEYSNTYWQTLRSTQGMFHLYGAYLDVRNASRIGPAVRLLAVHDRIKWKVRLFCQIWFEEHPGPVVVGVLEHEYMWDGAWGNHHDGVLQPYLLACVLPADVRALRPAAVSLVEKPCDRATNCLRVHFDEPPDRTQKEFAVCVKGLDFQHEDLSERLVEWIELVRLLGADKVFFYELQVHPNISKVIDYYRSQGIVESTPITLPGGQPNLPGLRHVYLKKKVTHKRQMELVPYNDCLYRHMYQYRWITLLDIDEMIVPMEDLDWKSLLKRVVLPVNPATGLSPCSSYLFRNVYYLAQYSREPGPPHYMYMLQRVHRTREVSKPGWCVKAFHDTRRVLVLHNHYPLMCLDGDCSSYPVGSAQARLHHYRADCEREPGKKMCEEPVRDATLWRWTDQLVPRVTQALSELGLLPSEPAFFSATAKSSSSQTPTQPSVY